MALSSEENKDLAKEEKTKMSSIYAEGDRKFTRRRLLIKGFATGAV